MLICNIHAHVHMIFNCTIYPRSISNDLIMPCLQTWACTHERMAILRSYIHARQETHAVSSRRNAACDSTSRAPRRERFATRDLSYALGLPQRCTRGGVHRHAIPCGKRHALKSTCFEAPTSYRQLNTLRKRNVHLCARTPLRIHRFIQQASFPGRGRASERSQWRVKEGDPQRDSDIST